MIDFNLIDANNKQLSASILNRVDIGLPWAYKIENVFTNALLEKIKIKFNSNTQWEKVNLQNDKNRNLIKWEPDSVIEEVHNIFESCQDIVSDVFKRKVVFKSVNFWKDLPGYTISPHIDNQQISIAIQVYIGESTALAGTELYLDNKQFTKLPWINNTGYILNNTPVSVHGMTIPSSQRTSVYGIYYDKL